MIASPAFATTAGLLAVLAVAACIRILLWQRRAPRAERSAPWRLGLLLLAQPAWAVLLLLAVHPPRLPPAAGAMSVLTAGATADDLPDGPAGRVVALPESGDTGGHAGSTMTAPATVARMPDLATALRLYPETRALHVFGDGLEQRDLDALPRTTLRFVPSVARPGLGDLVVPTSPVAGDMLRLQGHALALPGGRVEMLDPAGVRVDAASLADDGMFGLDAPTFVEGPATFTLRLLDAEGEVVEEAGLPVWLASPARPRVRLLAGAANAESRFLRRWATDAGLPVAAHVALGAGLGLGEGPAVPSRADLDRTDALIVDLRAWQALGAGGRATVLAAVEAGLGLVVRMDGPGVPAGLSDAMFRIEAAQGTQPWPWTLPAAPDADVLRARLGPGSEDAPFDPEQARAALPPLSLRDLRVSGHAAVPLDAGDVSTAMAPLGWWRGRGAGRVLLWRPQDTHRLVLLGRPDLHADLWRTAVGTIARSQPTRPPRIQAPAFEDERVAICGLGDEASVEAPDGRVSPLPIERRQGAGDACAGFWPHGPGWHAVMERGEVVGRWFVHPSDALPGVRAGLRRARTAAVACDGATCVEAPAGGEMHAPSPRGPAWPWWLGWLALSGVLWWLERSRLGRPAVSPSG
ncbi:hypothetical protein [Luteimonas abyssi]|uniref:hypothetical protein n=1 Tax=Luteimonas abyssi TaxID=1247514 RepID=UPI000737D3D9|nr:hypothetical protein [Luteimonas abyssi]